MIDQCAYIAKFLLGLDRAGRDLTVFPDDIFIVSFPRSGNTWTRFLVANLVHPDEPVTFANIERVVPDIHAQSKRYLKGIPRPRILKSHQYFDPRYKKVIYIVRDPRDVALSSYHFHRKQRQIEEGYPIEEYVSRFVTGTAWTNYASWGENVMSWVATRHNNHNAGPIGNREGEVFGTWAQNVSSWMGSRTNPNKFLLLRYEDMLKEPQSELAKVSAFLGMEAAPERLARAVELSSADHMRKLERKETAQWVMTKTTRQDMPFVRAATSGGWKADLPKSCIAEIEAGWAPIMRLLGYELTRADCEPVARSL